MSTLLQALKIALAPTLTLLLALKVFAGVHIGGRDVGELLGGITAALVLLLIEVGLTKGPRYSALTRRLIDSRAAFEGTWLQEVYLGQAENSIGLFFFDYQPSDDHYSVHGCAYSADGQRWATWESTQMFFESSLQATYLWKGELLGSATTPEADKSGLTRLELRNTGRLLQPVSGDGSVSHLLEGTRVKFKLRRVSGAVLRDFNLGFTLRDLRANAHDEELHLIRAYLTRKIRAAPLPQTPVAHA